MINVIIIHLIRINITNAQVCKGERWMVWYATAAFTLMSNNYVMQNRKVRHLISKCNMYVYMGK